MRNHTFFVIIYINDTTVPYKVRHNIGDIVIITLLEILANANT